MTTPGDLHVDMAVKFSKEGEAMGYNERIFLSSSIEDLTGWIEGRLLLGRLGVAEPTYSRTIFPPLTVLERVLGRGGDLIDNGRDRKSVV